MGRAASLICMLATGALVSLGAACGDRAQLLVVVDTDLPLASQIAATPDEFVPGITFDRLRIEVLDRNDRITLARTLRGIYDGYREIPIGPDTAWPITFGVREGSERELRLLLTAYRAADLDPTFVGLPVEEPDRRLAITRIADLEVPFSGKKTFRIVLRGSCLGVAPDLASGTTCVEDPSSPGAASTGNEPVESVPPTIAGTSPLGRALPCELAAPADVDAICVKGGVTARGDLALEYAGEVDGFLSAAPRHLVKSSAFYMDRTELTVGRFRRLLATGALAGEVFPNPRTAMRPGCTWTTEPGESEDRPLVCIEARTAQKVCVALGGDLPTDAQWDLAANGRGSREVYVWGKRPPACCAARLADLGGCGAGLVGPSRVGSFADPATCDGRADVSVDGILDLAGNVREIVRDLALRYGDDECPLEVGGIVVDPVCAPRSSQTKRKAARGGSFRSSFDAAKSSVRSEARVDDDVGFRCVYRGAP
jgi:formylglycine-generating enzyme required for sulfatase activity